MNHPFPTQQAPNPHLAASATNNSGEGSSSTVPPGIKGWSWGAFLLNWIWAIPNKTWIGLLAAVPYLGIIMAIYLGIKGRELAWKNKRWDSIEHFNQVQSAWSKWAVVIFVVVIVISVVIGFMLGIYSEY